MVYKLKNFAGYEFTCSKCGRNIKHPFTDGTSIFGSECANTQKVSTYLDWLQCRVNFKEAAEEYGMTVADFIKAAAVGTVMPKHKYSYQQEKKAIASKARGYRQENEKYETHS